LDYRHRKINIKNKNLIEFIHQLAAGKYLIPTFQRVFVWDPQHIRSLWDSIYQCYPIGTILYWKTPTALHVHRKLGGFLLPDNGDSDPAMWSYILDGQQRATALLVSFYGGTGKIREQCSFDFTLYFDLTTTQFFFEKDYHKHRWEADAAFLVRLKDVPDLPADYCRQLKPLQGYSEGVDQNFEQLKYVFLNTHIPLICLEQFDIAGVCGIYERINQTGVRLTNLDILIARGFKNYPTIVEEDFPIP
jgi:uncharacterized protein with ParB-like and HNH nuclease domain